MSCSIGFISLGKKSKFIIPRCHSIRIRLVVLRLLILFSDISLIALARVAEKYSFTKPSIVDEKVILIREGSNPLYPQEGFIPNDLFLSEQHSLFKLITGTVFLLSKLELTPNRPECFRKERIFEASRNYRHSCPDGKLRPCTRGGVGYCR